MTMLKLFRSILKKEETSPNPIHYCKLDFVEGEAPIYEIAFPMEKIMRLERFRQCIGITAKVFSKAIGLSERQYRTLLKGSYELFTEEVLFSVLDKYPIRIEWLYWGEGQMMYSKKNTGANA